MALMLGGAGVVYFGVLLATGLRVRTLLRR
jgi:putative peptidoglycan lipid II flippase